MNPTQLSRARLAREDVVGSRMSRPEGLDERTRSYLEVAASAARSGSSVRSELHIEGDDAYELLEAYPVGRDRWALSALDITGVRHAERALRRQEEDIRRAYVDVLAAVTGGKLILLTDDELAGQLGVPLMEPERVAAPRELAEARGAIARTASERFPDWAPQTDLRTPAGEALVNALRHAGGGSYQLFARDDRLQVLVRDDGPGIDFRTLPAGHAAAGVLDGREPGHGLHDHAAGLRARPAQHAAGAHVRGPGVRRPAFPRGEPGEPGGRGVVVGPGERAADRCAARPAGPLSRSR